LCKDHIGRVAHEGPESKKESAKRG
jgi:hypothetical protein